MSERNYSVSVFAPATVSNVGPGFDFFGFALDAPGDIITATLTNNHSTVVITEITNDNNKLPRESSLNTAGIPALRIRSDFSIYSGIDLKIEKQMGIGSGLGSSAASAVASVIALNELFELELELSQLLHYAALGETAASGSVHYDNIAPCLYGGFVIYTGIVSEPVLHIKVPDALYCTVIHPDIEIKTSQARKILPAVIPVQDTVQQARFAASLVIAMQQGNYHLFKDLIIDAVAEPHRANLIPWYQSMKDAVLNAGGFNCNISGSGPSMFAFSADLTTAQKLGEIMQHFPNMAGVTSTVYISKINKQGPVIL